MSVEYSINVLNPRGEALLPDRLTSFIKLDVAAKVNDVGVLKLDISSMGLPKHLFRKDNRIEVWRKVDMNAPYLEGDQQYLIRKMVISKGILSVTAYDLKSLLKRRIVAYDAGSQYTDKSDYADDMMKEIMSENFGVGCIDADRDISEWLSIQDSFGLAMPIEKAFCRRSVFTVFQELAQASYEAGIFLAFDIVRTTRNMVEFRTYINQRGTDHTKSNIKPLIFGSKYGNFTDEEYTEDSTDEITFVYAGGQGEEDDRVIETAQDDDRIGVSPFGRIESFVDARQAELATTVEDEAEAELRSKRPLKRISGKIVDTDKCKYGIHYRFGDKVGIESTDASFDAFINSVHITAANGIETVDIGLEAVW